MPGPFELSIEMNITACAENHTGHEKRTESLPVPVIVAPCFAVGVWALSRYRDLWTVWHPDRFEHDTKMKDKATNEFQKIQ